MHQRSTALRPGCENVRNRKLCILHYLGNEKMRVALPTANSPLDGIGALK